MIELASWKIIMGSTLILMTFIGGLLPLKLRGNENIMSIGNILSSGVFLGTSLVHMIPEAYQNLEDHVDLKWNLPFVLCGLGLFSIVFFEEVIVIWQKSLSHQHLQQRLSRISERSPSPQPTNSDPNVLAKSSEGEHEKECSSIIARTVVESLYPRTTLVSHPFILPDSDLNPTFKTRSLPASLGGSPASSPRDHPSVSVHQQHCCSTHPHYHYIPESKRIEYQGEHHHEKTQPRSRTRRRRSRKEKEEGGEDLYEIDSSDDFSQDSNSSHDSKPSSSSGPKEVIEEFPIEEREIENQKINLNIQSIEHDIIEVAIQEKQKLLSFDLTSPKQKHKDHEKKPKKDHEDGHHEKKHKKDHEDGHHEKKHKKDHEEGGHDHSIPSEFLSSDGKENAYIAYLLVMALSIHSFFESAALGSSTDFRGVFSLWIAISAHKILSAFALGSSLLRADVSRSTLVRLLSCFCLTTVFGIGIGYALTEGTSGSTASIVSGCANSFAAGTFLYIGLCDILPKELSVQGSAQILLIKLVCFFGGFSAMASLAMFFG